MAKEQKAKPELSVEEEIELLKTAPITEVASYLGVDLDVAVQLRVDRMVDDAYSRLGISKKPDMDISVRPITPIGNLVGFASVKFNDVFVVEDFKILQSDKGMFVGMPSKPDKSSNTGYRDTAKPITAEFRKELIGAIVTEYHSEVEKLQTRAASIAAPQKPSIQNQLAEATEKAAKNNATRPDQSKGNKAKNVER